LLHAAAGQHRVRARPGSQRLGCANPLGLAVFALAYRAVGMRLELRRFVGWNYFALICFVSAVFSSAGALIWNHLNQVDRLGQLPIWQGWWVGAFLQQLLVVGPLMMLSMPALERWRIARPQLCPPGGRDPRRRALRLVLVIVVAVLGYGALTLSLAEARLQALRPSLTPLAQDAAQTMLSTAWALFGVGALVLLFIGQFGYQVFRHWSNANARLLEVLAEQARTDRLSGLLNHRAMEEALTEQLQRRLRHGEPAALLMIDIDHFKQINDRFGHAIGDAAIELLAEVLRATQRGIDRCGRWGGEEFLVLLPQQDQAGALACAERFRRALAERGPRPAFTVSIGVATLAADDAGWDSWLRRADAALYAAKTRGRDQVCSA